MILIRRVMLACFFLSGSLALSPVALAQSGNLHDRTQFGSNITVGPNEQVGDVTCFACSVRIRGHVAGDVTVFGGSVTLEDQAQVGGDITNFGRGVRFEGNAHIGGDVTAFGGAVRRDPGATIGGEVTSFNGSLWLLLVFGLPFVIFGAIVSGIIWVVRRIIRPSVPLAA